MQEGSREDGVIGAKSILVRKCHWKEVNGVKSREHEGRGYPEHTRVQDNGMDSDTRTSEEESAARETRLGNQKQLKEEWIVFLADQKGLKRNEPSILKRKQFFFYCRIHIKTYLRLPCLIYPPTCKPEPRGSQFFLCCPSYPQPPEFHEISLKPLGQDGDVRTHLISKIMGLILCLVQTQAQTEVSQRFLLWVRTSPAESESLACVCSLASKTHILWNIFFLRFQPVCWSLPWLSEALFKNRDM